MPTSKVARAEVRPRRQRTQYSCMACSMAMCLTANGIDTDEDTVNEVMGAQPMRGAAWEQALACAQHYGMRATLTVPATLSQVKAWTDKGIPVMIAWNPEGREWSHASVVIDVVPDDAHGFMVHVADPNIPDPEQTVRVVTKDEFYKKWYEKWPNYLVRRPAMAIEREITQDGRQVMASRMKDEADHFRVASSDAGWPDAHTAKVRDTVKIKKEDLPKPRHGPEFVENVMRRPGGGAHHTREHDVAKGRGRKEKHKRDWNDRESAELVAAWGALGRDT